MKRSHGSGHLYLKHGSYYGRWRGVDGRLVNKKIGKVRTRGDKDGITRADAERGLRGLVEAERRQHATEIARPYGLLVLTLEGDEISAMTWFGDSSVFPLFGLPRTLRVRRADGDVQSS